jgi:hypothetical protein
MIVVLNHRILWKDYQVILCSTRVVPLRKGECREQSCEAGDWLLEIVECYLCISPCATGWNITVNASRQRLRLPTTIRDRILQWYNGNDVTMSRYTHIPLAFLWNIQWPSSVCPIIFLHYSIPIHEHTVHVYWQAPTSSNPTADVYDLIKIFSCLPSQEGFLVLRMPKSLAWISAYMTSEKNYTPCTAEYNATPSKVIQKLVPQIMNNVAVSLRANSIL